MSDTKPDASGAAPPDPKVCSVCGKTAPETETDYTLISAKHGWRLSIQRAPDGRRSSLWICKSCWEKRAR